MVDQKHNFLQNQRRRYSQGQYQKPAQNSTSIESKHIMIILSFRDLGDKYALALDKTNQYLNLNTISSVIVLFGEHVGLNWV